MAGPPFDILANLPEDDDIVSQHPADERSFRDIVESWLLTNHDVNGNHKAVVMAITTPDPTFGSNLAGIWQNTGVLNYRVQAGTVMRILNMPVGTRMVFDQATAPTGWTTDGAAADRVLRVVGSGSGGVSNGTWVISGLSVSGHALSTSELPAHSHPLSSGNSTVSTVLDHNHGGVTGTTGSHSHGYLGHNTSTPVQSGVGASALTGTQARTTDPAGDHAHSISSDGGHAHTLSGSTDNTGGGSTHTHGLGSAGTWRPASRDVVIGVLS